MQREASGQLVYPLSKEHVLTKLSIPQSRKASSTDRQTKVACAHCGHELPSTPVVKTHLTKYFTGVMHITDEVPKKGSRNNLKIRVEEVLTSDEFMELLTQDGPAKKKAVRGKRKNTRGKTSQQTCPDSSEGKSHNLLKTVINNTPYLSFV